VSVTEARRLHDALSTGTVGGVRALSSLRRFWPFGRRRRRRRAVEWWDGPDEEPALVRSGPPRRPRLGGAVALELPREETVTVADAGRARGLAALLARLRLRLRLA
jgi:hypothetical protein